MTQHATNSHATIKSHIDLEYIELLHSLSQTQERFNERTQTNTKGGFFNFIHHDIAKHGFPLISARRTPLRWIFEETMMFLRGQTNVSALKEKGISIWDGNSSREFLDNKGFHNWPEGEIGPGSYGGLWRNFPYTKEVDQGFEMMATVSDTVDQIAELIANIKERPYDRYNIVSAWHPYESKHNAALPACHILQQYYVTADGHIDSLFYMRSSDVLYGLPFNLAQYAFMNIVIAKVTGYKPGKLTYVGGDCHIYENQYEAVDQLLEQTDELGVAESPQLTINKELNTLEDIMSLEFTDLELTGYNPNPDIKNKPPMVV